jgi:anti-anti-sigma regulatory factor
MQPEAQRLTMQFGRTSLGYLVCVSGKGTLHESSALQEFALLALAGPAPTDSLFVDLSNCDYLDSTFLGCLALLHRRHNQIAPHRFLVVASPDRCAKLLAPTHLDRLLDVTDQRPEFDDGSLITMDKGVDSHQLFKHVMETHRRLAEVRGPGHAEFQSIADRLAEELDELEAGEESPTGVYEPHAGPAN